MVDGWWWPDGVESGVGLGDCGGLDLASAASGGGGDRVWLDCRLSVSGVGGATRDETRLTTLALVGVALGVATGVGTGLASAGLAGADPVRGKESFLSATARSVGGGGESASAPPLAAESALERRLLKVAAAGGIGDFLWCLVFL